MTDREKWLKFVSEEDLQELEKFPDLRDAIAHTFVYNDYDKKYLSPLVVWFREKEDNGYPVIEAADWDDDTLDEFYSWGSNSRWSSVFESEVFKNAGYYIGLALEIAREYNS